MLTRSWSQGKMIFPPFFAAFALLHFPGPVQAALAPTAPMRPALGAPRYDTNLKIRVRILEAVSRVRIRGFDLTMGGGSSGRSLAAFRRADRASEWDFHCQSGRIRATRVDRSGGIGGATTIELPEPAIIQSPAGFLKIQDKSYRETVRIHAEGSLCEAVNEIDLEKYLSGLVNAEFNSRWSPEAVGAQVVAARTYALFKIREARTSGLQHFDLDSTQRDQVYDGSVREDPRSTRAVERTRGLVLTSNGTLPLKAFYHSTCGGRTELPQKVWGNPFPGFHKTVPCPFCAGSPGFHWETTFSTQEVAQALKRGARSEGAPSAWPADWERILTRAGLEDMQTEQADPEGRVERVKTRWTWGGSSFQLTVSASKFREWVGAARLKSAKFSFTPSRSSVAGAWHIVGRGNGHGVGMCQWGAKVMGDRGFTTASILRHYYPDSILRKLW